MARTDGKRGEVIRHPADQAGVPCHEPARRLSEAEIRTPKGSNGFHMTSLPSGPYVDWYETWLAQHGKRSAAEAAARAKAERQMRLIVRLFVGWAAVVTAAAFASVWWVM